MPLITNGEVEFTDVHCTSEVICAEGSIHIENTFITSLTATDTGTDVTVDVSNSRFSTITLTDIAGTGYCVFSGCSVSSRFIADGCTNLQAELNVRTTANATAVDLTDCTMVNLTGSVRATGSAIVIRAEDVVASEIGMLVIADPGADNTYDSVSLEGVCDRVSLRGSIRGAIFGANNPRYGLAVAAGCLAIDVWTPISGYQTGAINDLTAGQVTVH